MFAASCNVGSQVTMSLVGRQASTTSGNMMSMFERKLASAMESQSAHDASSSSGQQAPSGGRLAEKRHSDSLAIRRSQPTSINSTSNSNSNNNSNIVQVSNQLSKISPFNLMPMPTQLQMQRNQQQQQSGATSTSINRTANLHPTLTATITGKQTSSVGSSALLAARLSVNSLGSHFSANGKAQLAN